MLGLGGRKPAVVLSFAAVLLLASSWLFAAERGVAIALACMVFGWMVRHLALEQTAPVAPEPMPVVRQAPVESDVAARLQVLEAKTSSLRHDLRGILSPALLIGERLLSHDDPAVRRAGDIMVKTVERASTRLAETKA